MNNNVPEIRFKGFVDDWEQRKLLEMLVQSVTDGPHETPDLVDEGITFISVDAIVDNKIDFTRKRGCITEKYHEECCKKYKPEIYDVYLVKSGSTVGKVAIVETNEQFNIWSPLAAMRCGVKSEPYFLYYLLQTTSLQNQVFDKCSHGTQPNLSMRQLEKFDVLIPNVLEQKKIGKLFQDIDDTIALYLCELEALEKIKIAFLEKIFNQEIRFSGFNKVWEQCKLGEVADIIGGGTPSTDTNEYWGGGIDWYSPVEIGEQIYVNGSQKTITELGLQKSSAKILPVGTVLFTSRAGIGSTAILAKEGATNQGFQSVVPYKDKLDSYFIFSRTHELKRYGETNGAGSTFAEVSGKQMAKMPILIPSLEEQIKIGKFFKQLDNTIALHRQKIDYLHKLKHAYLKKMFL